MSLIVLIPLSGNNALSTSEELLQWHTTESNLLETQWKVPVYFAVEDDELRTIYADSLSSSKDSADSGGFLSAGDRHMLVVSSTEPAAIKEVTASNFQVSITCQ